MENRGKNLVYDTWCIHQTQAAQALADLNPTGMSEDIKAQWIAYKRVCAHALFDFFTKGVAVNPRLAHGTTDPALLAILDRLTDNSSRAQAVAESASAKAIEAKEEVARVAERLAALDARIERTRGSSATSKPEKEPAAPKDISRMGVRQVLEFMGLPLDMKSSPSHHYAFAPIAFQALALSGHAERSWPVPRVHVERAKPYADRAVAQMHLDGHRVIDGLLRWVGPGRQLTPETVRKHMLNAMRRVDPGPGGQGHGNPQTAFAGV